MATTLPPPATKKCQAPDHQAFNCTDIYGIVLCATCWFRYRRARAAAVPQNEDLFDHD